MIKNLFLKHWFGTAYLSADISNSQHTAIRLQQHLGQLAAVRSTEAINTKTLLCHLYAQPRTEVDCTPMTAKVNKVTPYLQQWGMCLGRGSSLASRPGHVQSETNQIFHLHKLWRGDPLCQRDRETFVKMPSWRSSCCSCPHLGTFWNSWGRCRKLAECRAVARKDLWREMAGALPSHMETNAAEHRAEIQPCSKTDLRPTTYPLKQGRGDQGESKPWTSPSYRNPKAALNFCTAVSYQRGTGPNVSQVPVFPLPARMASKDLFIILLCSPLPQLPV